MLHVFSEPSIQEALDYSFSVNKYIIYCSHLSEELESGFDFSKNGSQGHGYTRIIMKHLEMRECRIVNLDTVIEVLAKVMMTDVFDETKERYRHIYGIYKRLICFSDKNFESTSQDLLYKLAELYSNNQTYLLNDTSKKTQIKVEKICSFKRDIRVTSLLLELKNDTPDLYCDFDENIMPGIQYLLQIIEKPHLELDDKDKNVINGVLDLIQRECFSFNYDKVLSEAVSENGIARLLYFLYENFFIPFRNGENELRVLIEQEVITELQSFYEKKSRSVIDKVINNDMQGKSLKGTRILALIDSGSYKFGGVMEEAEKIYQKLISSRSRGKAFILLEERNNCPELQELFLELSHFMPESSSELETILLNTKNKELTNTHIFLFLHTLLSIGYFEDNQEINFKVSQYCLAYFKYKAGRYSRASEISIKRGLIQYNVDLIVSEKNGRSRIDINTMMGIIENDEDSDNGELTADLSNIEETILNFSQTALILIDSQSKKELEDIVYDFINFLLDNKVFTDETVANFTAKDVFELAIKYIQKLDACGYYKDTPDFQSEIDTFLNIHYYND